MQIRKLILYGNNDKVRELTFELGKVNIISGESKTGKTAIIEIINYCLASDGCNIPDGVIREKVKWFALIINFGKEEIFVARQNPNILGKKTTSNIHYNLDTRIDQTPQIEDIQVNSNISAFAQILESKLGISEYTHSAEGNTRDSLTVRFSHARTYCFQPQDLIAQKDSLFFKHNSENGGFVRQATKDTLPYFLGAIREDTLRIEQEIALVNKALRKLVREQNSAEDVRLKGVSKLYELVEEATEVGLMPSLITKGNDEDEQLAKDALTKVLNWTNEENSLLGENDVLTKLMKDRDLLRTNLRKTSNELDAAKSFAEEVKGYGEEVKEQRQRLTSINLYKEPQDNKRWNSLIGQDVDYVPPTIEEINKSLEELSKSLENNTQGKPKLRNHINKLETQIQELKEDIKLLNNQISAIYKEQKEAEKLKNLNIRKGKVIGKISLFLESIDISEDISVKKKIEELKAKLEELKSEVSPEEKAEKMEGIMNRINFQMSNWSEFFDLEYQDAPIRFDPKRFMIFADTDQRPIPLNQMGSGANWMSYHLLLHFALHKHFIEKFRPVPNFLVIDQPSQVYYPPEKDEELQGEVQSSDEVAVKKMYDFMFKVVKELSPNFQVIVTDHARLRYEEFEKSIVEIWRDGVKLVPIDW